MPKIIDDESVFRAVIQTIGAHGYTAATTKQMAEAAGISEVSLFRKYESKLLLVKRAIAFITQENKLDSAAQYSGDVRQDLLSVLHAYQNSILSHGQFIVVLFSEVSRHAELVDSFNQPLNIFQDIGQLLARYQAKGVLQQEQPMHAVVALLGPLMAANIIRNLVSANIMPELDLNSHIDYFLQGRLSA